jgi:ribonuclease R
VSGEDELLLRAMRDKTGQSGAVDGGGAPSGRSDKSRRGRDAGSASRKGASPAAPAMEVKSAVRKAAGKKTDRGGARSAASKSRKSRR